MNILCLAPPPPSPHTATSLPLEAYVPPPSYFLGLLPSLHPSFLNPRFTRNQDDLILILHQERPSSLNCFASFSPSIHQYCPPFPIFFLHSFSFFFLSMFCLFLIPSNFPSSLPFFQFLPPSSFPLPFFPHFLSFFSSFLDPPSLAFQLRFLPTSPFTDR